MKIGNFITLLNYADCKKSGIYKIEHITSKKCYIGSSKNIYNRLYDHMKCLRSNKHRNIKLQRAYNKYGETSFELSILETISDTEQLLIREQYWLDKTKSYERKVGYNIQKDPTRPPLIKHSTATKKKLSLIAKKRVGSKNGFFGKSWKDYPEALQAMKQTLSASLSGVNNPFYGKRHSEETKNLLSLKLTGRQMPESFLAKQKGNERGAKILYKITFQDNKVILVRNLSKFARENNLISSSLRCAANKNKKYKDFSIVKIGFFDKKNIFHLYDESVRDLESNLT